MFRVARKMVGDSDTAADIVQDVFISLFDKLNTGIVILHLNSWLYKATLNKCADDVRKQKRFRTIDLLKNHTTEETAYNLESAAIINKALSKLKPQEKSIVVLYSEGLSYKEIAEATGIRFSSVGKTLQRSLEKLGEELKNQHDELY